MNKGLLQQVVSRTLEARSGVSWPGQARGRAGQGGGLAREEGWPGRRAGQGGGLAREEGWPGRRPGQGEGLDWSVASVLNKPFHSAQCYFYDGVVRARRPHI